MAKIQHPIIDNWNIASLFQDGLHLIGTITGHQNPEVGKEGYTSATSRIIGVRDGRVVTESGTEYRLGVCTVVGDLAHVKNMKEV